MTVLEIRELRKTFDSEQVPVRAIRSVELRVEEGEYVAIMGPSGCGKSTLLNIVAGLYQPDAGEVVVGGESLIGMTEDELAGIRRMHIGIVFQFFNLLEGMSAVENVALAGLIAGLGRNAAQDRARDLLAVLGLQDKVDVLPAGLSGGQRQRLAIARALANSPTLLLADEPTGALDSEGAEEITELFGRLRRDGQTIVLVTHDETVAATAGRLVSMRDGRIDDQVPAAALTVPRTV